MTGLEWVLGGAGGIGLGVVGTVMAMGLRRGDRPGGPEFIQNMAEGYYRSSLGGDLLACNPAFARLLGYPTSLSATEDGRNLAARFYRDEWRRADISNVLYREGSVSGFVSKVNRRGNRGPIWVSESSRLVRDMFGRPRYYEGTITDVTDTVERLELERRQTMLARNAPAILMQIRYSKDAGLRVVYASDALEHTFGENVAKVRREGLKLSDLVHPDDRQRMMDDGNLSVRNRTQLRQTYRMLGGGGDYRHVEIHASNEIEADGILWHGFLIDVTESRNMEAQAHQLAHFDQLTGLPNRRSILDTLKSAVAGCSREGTHAALALVDLDGFKEINAAHGHGLGDHVLKAVADRFRTVLGDDARLGRTGADEFAFVALDLSHKRSLASSDACALADRLHAAMREPVTVMGVTCEITCSVGIALIDDAGMVPNEIMGCADAALASAREGGRGRSAVFEPAMRRRMGGQIALASELRQALRRDEFELYYQPQTLADGTVAGAEALLRWNHPDKGLVGPGDFIVAAERSGMIVQMTDHVIEKGFETLRTWSERPHMAGLDLSINVSPQQFTSATFLQRMGEHARRHPALSRRMTLELTEHVLFGDIDRLTHTMDALREMGFRFSLDDFGTGYSSFAHLRRLPFDEVKIDGSFVTDLAKSAHDRAIVRSIVAMARALDLQCVAEWVENEDQRSILELEGCQRMQGFLFGAAVPLTEFDAAATRDRERRRPEGRDRPANGSNLHRLPSRTGLTFAAAASVQ